VASISTAGQGFFLSDGHITGTGGYLTSLSQVSAVANQVKVAQFVLPVSITVTHVTMTVGATAVSTCNVGIYDAPATTKLVDSGNFNGNSATTQTLTIGAVTLPPGVYWFAVACSSTVVTSPSFANPTGTPVTPTWNNQAVRVGTAANSSAGGLPATLGAITSTAINTTIAMFEP